MNGFTAGNDCALSNFACITEEVGTNGQHDLTIRIADEQIEQPAAEELYAQQTHLSSVSTQSNDVLTAALSYAARGWQVIPLHSPRRMDAVASHERVIASANTHELAAG